MRKGKKVRKEKQNKESKRKKENEWLKTSRKQVTARREARKRGIAGGRVRNKKRKCKERAHKKNNQNEMLSG